MSEKVEQKVPEEERGLSEIAVAIRQIRRILEMTQPEFGPFVGVSGKSYPSYETGQRNPDAEMLERAKALYKEKTGHPWMPGPTMRDLVREGQAANAGLSERHRAEAVQRAIAAGASANPTDRDRWLALQALENALRERGLMGAVLEEERKMLAGILARGISAGDTLEEIRKEFHVVVGVLEKSRRKVDG